MSPPVGSIRSPPPPPQIKVWKKATDTGSEKKAIKIIPGAPASAKGKESKGRGNLATPKITLGIRAHFCSAHEVCQTVGLFHRSRYSFSIAICTMLQIEINFLTNKYHDKGKSNGAIERKERAKREKKEKRKVILVMAVRSECSYCH